MEQESGKRGRRRLASPMGSNMEPRLKMHANETRWPIQSPKGRYTWLVVAGFGLVGLAAIYHILFLPFPVLVTQGHPLYTLTLIKAILWVMSLVRLVDIAYSASSGYIASPINAPPSLLVFHAKSNSLAFLFHLVMELLLWGAMVRGGFLELF